MNILECKSEKNRLQSNIQKRGGEKKVLSESTNSGLFRLWVYADLKEQTAYFLAHIF